MPLAMRNALAPDELEMVARVTDEACRQLGCDGIMRVTIATRVVGFANKGERRYGTLLAIALDRVTPFKPGGRP